MGKCRLLFNHGFRWSYIYRGFVSYRLSMPASFIFCEKVNVDKEANKTIKIFNQLFSQKLITLLVTEITRIEKSNISGTHETFICTIKATLSFFPQAYSISKNLEPRKHESPDTQETFKHFRTLVCEKNERNSVVLFVWDVIEPFPLASKVTSHA